LIEKEARKKKNLTGKKRWRRKKKTVARPQEKLGTRKKRDANLRSEPMRRGKSRI